MVPHVAGDSQAFNGAVDAHAGDGDITDIPSSPCLGLEVDGDAHVGEGDVLEDDVLHSARGFAADGDSGEGRAAGDSPDGDV